MKLRQRQARAHIPRAPHPQHPAGTLHSALLCSSSTREAGRILLSLSEEGDPWQGHAESSPAGLAITTSGGPASPLLGSSPSCHLAPPSSPSQASPPLAQATSLSPWQEESHPAKQENGAPTKAPRCLPHLSISIPLAPPPIQGAPCKCHLRHPHLSPPPKGSAASWLLQLHPLSLVSLSL